MVTVRPGSQGYSRKIAGLPETPRFAALIVSELTAYYQEMLDKKLVVNRIGTC